MKQNSVTKSIASLLLACAVLYSCSDNGKQQQETQAKEAIVERKTVKKAKPANAVPQTISIYRYNGCDKGKAERLAQALGEYFPKVQLKEKLLPLPSQYYDKERNRYKGTGLLEDLGKYRNGDAIIGLTDYVIFKANNISPTYGIMGVSPVGTYKCVVSSKIPSNGKEQAADNFTKLALHELGHAFGLNHCEDQHCYMVDAEHKMKFPQTKGFCKTCKEVLSTKGWRIK